MCMVSAVINSLPQQQFPPIQQWTLPQAYDFRDVIRRLDELDRKLGAKDCYEPTKADFLKALEERIAKLETRLGDHGAAT